MDNIIVADVRRPGDGWQWTFAYGVALMFSGVIALGWPFASALAIGIFLGWALSIAGLCGIVAGIRARRLRGHRLDAAVGLLSVVLGLLVLLDPLAGALVLLWTMSLRFAISGVMEIAAGWRHEGERIALYLLGALDLLLAMLLLAGFASGDVALVAILAGLSFLAGGLVAVSVAIHLRAVAREARN